MIFKKYFLYIIFGLMLQNSNVFGIIFGPGKLHQQVRAYKAALAKADEASFEEAEKILNLIKTKVETSGQLDKSEPLRNFLTRHGFLKPPSSSSVPMPPLQIFKSQIAEQKLLLNDLKMTNKLEEYLDLASPAYKTQPISLGIFKEDLIHLKEYLSKSNFSKEAKKVVKDVLSKFKNYQEGTTAVRIQIKNEIADEIEKITKKRGSITKPPSGKLTEPAKDEEPWED